MRRHRGLIPLSHEHQHALALCVLIERALGADGGADAVAGAAADLTKAFDTEIRDHFRFEERALFPLLEKYEGLAPVVLELKTEHSRILRLVDALRRGGKRPDVLEFCSTLRAHVRKEESVLFERAQEVLTPEELNAIGEQRSGRKPFDFG